MPLMLAMAERVLRVLDHLRRDERGEVIPTAIIYAVVALLAIALVTAASDYVYGWIGLWPDPAAPPAAP